MQKYIFLAPLAVVVGWMLFSLLNNAGFVDETKQITPFRLGTIVDRPIWPRIPLLRQFYWYPALMYRVEITEARTVVLELPRQNIRLSDGVVVEFQLAAQVFLARAPLAIRYSKDYFEAAINLVQYSAVEMLSSMALQDTSDYAKLNILLKQRVDDTLRPHGMLTSLVAFVDLKPPDNLIEALASEAEATADMKGILRRAEQDGEVFRLIVESLRTAMPNASIDQIIEAALRMRSNYSVDGRNRGTFVGIHNPMTPSSTGTPMPPPQPTAQQAVVTTS